MVNKTMLIEDVVQQKPDAVGYLMNKGMKCIACGEPIWGTLESAAAAKGFSEREIDVLVSELNELRTLSRTV